MGRSAKMTKRFSKADRVAKKVNAQSGPTPLSRSASPDHDPDAPLAIPLFNTSVPGRVGKQATSHSHSHPSRPQQPDSDDDDGLEPALEGDRASSSATAAAAPQQKKKGGLRDKVRAAKKAVQDDEDRSNDKLSGAQKRKQAKKHNVLGTVDYVKLHEARPGKKKFR
ncbi:hypothetical protein JCM9279_004865 [Rhodotorula babjevae]